MKDYYKILGVERNASAIAIRKAYRKKALTLHPDVNQNPNAHDTFIELTEAYKVLNNPEKKSQYDRLYDYNILNKPPKQQSRYEKREPKRKQNVDRQARRGRNKGERYAQETDRRFEKRTNWWAIFEVIGSVLEVVFRIIYLLARAMR